MADQPDQDHHHHGHDHAPAIRTVTPQRRVFSLAQHGLGMRLALVAVLVAAIWVVIALLVRS